MLISMLSSVIITFELYLPILGMHMQGLMDRLRHPSISHRILVMTVFMLSQERTKCL